MANGGPPPPGVVRVLVLLSDGVANVRLNGTNCADNPTMANACTMDAEAQATLAKNAMPQTVVYTVGLNLTNPVAIASMLAMASDPDKAFNADNEDISMIFEEIANELILDRRRQCRRH